MMYPKFSPLRLAVVSLAGAAGLVSCDKQESATTPPAMAIPAGPVAAAVTPSADPANVVPVAGDAALAAFKAEIASIKAFMEANQGNQDPAAGLADVRELVKRASAVKTEGLPEDLASAYQAMTGVMQRLQSTLDDLPVPVNQLQDYLSKEQAKGPAATQEVTAKVAAFKAAMDALQKDGEAANATMKEVGAKYGIESLDLGSR